MVFRFKSKRQESIPFFVPPSSIPDSRRPQSKCIIWPADGQKCFSDTQERRWNYGLSNMYLRKTCRKVLITPWTGCFL